MRAKSAWKNLGNTHLIKTTPILIISRYLALQQVQNLRLHLS